MEHHHPTGNAKVDGILLFAIGFGAYWSRITVNHVVSGLTAIGAVLYIANQSIILYNNVKSKKQ